MDHPRHGSPAPDERDHPTSGPGKVSVDEPTQPALDPDSRHLKWGRDAAGVAEGGPPEAEDLVAPPDLESETD